MSNEDFYFSRITQPLDGRAQAHIGKDADI
jgi:hypothetical protein